MRSSLRWAAMVAATFAVTATLVAPSSHAATGPSEPTIGPLISGTASIIGGTHVWTDYAYDDGGPNATAPANTGNLADLIQLQVHPGPAELGIRVVLETLVDAKVPLLGVGLDLDSNPATGARTLPGGQWQVAGTPLGLERVVLVVAGRARVLAWDGQEWKAVGSARATVDPRANTMDATIPYRLLGKVGARWRVVGALGRAAASWADGKGPISDLAYVRDHSAFGAGQLSNWQSGTQAAVLSGKLDAASAVATLDLAALRTNRDVVARPTPGIKNTFLYRSRLELGEGIGADDTRKYAGPYQPYVVWLPKEGLPERPPLVVFLHGAMGNHLGGSYGDDAYFVEEGPIGAGPGVIAPKAVVITPLGRGESPLGYPGPAEQDILDAIADASARFAVDEDRVVMTGYSLGGVGTFRLAQLYPDRWAGAVEIVGADDLGALTVEEEAGGAQTLPNQLENLRNLPFRMAHSRLDELEAIVGAVQPDRAALELHRLGYDYRYWQLYRRDHLTFPVAFIQCELDAAIARGRVRNPARVVYSQEPAIPSRDPRTGLDVPHDRAYWMSAMVVRGTRFRPGDKGTADITSLARADRVPTTQLVLAPGENLSAGRDACGDNPRVTTADVWTVQGQRWLPGPPQPVSNGLVATLTRVALLALDLPRMGLDVGRPLELRLTTDGPTRVRLLAPWPRAVSVEREGRPPALVCPTKGRLEIAASGASTVQVAPSSRECH